MKITIVNASEVSVEDYKNLRLTALKEEPHAFASSYEEHKNLPNEKWEEWLNNYKSGEKSWMIFAKENESLVGMIGAFSNTDGNIADIIATFVIKEKRGQGVSKKLMSELISIIKRDTKVKKLQLGVTTTQTPALNLYKSLGFTTVKEHKEKLGDGKIHNVTIMEKDF